MCQKIRDPDSVAGCGFFFFFLAGFAGGIWLCFFFIFRCEAVTSTRMKIQSEKDFNCSFDWGSRIKIARFKAFPGPRFTL